MPSTNRLSEVIAANADAILPEWLSHQLAAVTSRRDLVREDELRDQSRRFLELLNSSLKRDGGADVALERRVEQLEKAPRLVPELVLAHEITTRRDRRQLVAQPFGQDRVGVRSDDLG